MAGDVRGDGAICRDVLPGRQLAGCGVHAGPRTTRSPASARGAGQTSVSLSPPPMNPLQQTERDVLQQSEAWARTQLEEQLQRQADQVAMANPQTGERLSNIRRRKMNLRTVSGRVHLRVKIGYSQQRRRWLNPIRQIWQMAPYQQVSPELQARVCQTATLVPTYEGAVATARCWGCTVSDDLIHRHVQDQGRKAAGLVLPLEKPPAREAAFSLVIMMDGWMARE